MAGAAAALAEAGINPERIGVPEPTLAEDSAGDGEDEGDDSLDEEGKAKKKEEDDIFEGDRLNAIAAAGGIIPLPQNPEPIEQRGAQALQR